MSSPVVPVPNAVAPTSDAALTCTATPHIIYGFDGASTFAAALTDGIAPCYDVTVNLTSYNVPVGWDGNSFDLSATPQTEFATTTLTFPAYSTAEVTASVPVPTCGNYQADAYAGNVQAEITWPDGTDGFLAGSIVHQVACATPDVSAGPDFTEATCSGSTAGYQIAAVAGVDFYARVDTGTAVLATVGSFAPVTAGHSVVITAVAKAGYPAPTGYPTGGWTHTFATVGSDCATTPNPSPTPTTPTVVIVPVVAMPTGTVTEACPTDGGDESYTVTLTNPAATTDAPVQFRVLVNGGLAATSSTVASGAIFTDPGALPAGASAVFTADYRAVGATSWTPVTISGAQSTFPCVGVKGESFTKPTVVQPVTVSKPVTTAPGATLPFTGLPAIPTAMVALVLVAAGGLLLFVARRPDRRY